MKHDDFEKLKGICLEADLHFQIDSSLYWFQFKNYEYAIARDKQFRYSLTRAKSLEKQISMEYLSTRNLRDAINFFVISEIHDE